MSEPDLLIFTEASDQVGHGHVVRCRALALEARRRGLKVNFWAPDVYLAQLLESWGEKTINRKDGGPPPAFIVCDKRQPHAAADIEQCMARGSMVLLLDDLGPARTVASLVADALMTPRRSRLYPHGPNTGYLYGLRYAPLHRQFLEQHSQAAAGATVPGRLLVSFGGRDPHNVTGRFLAALDDLGFRGPASVIADAAAPGYPQLEKIINRWDHSDLTHDVRDMALRMRVCDVVATKLGVTMLEAFCVGLGCILIEPTPAHLELQEDLAETYDAWPVKEFGLAESLDFHAAAAETMALLKNPGLLAAWGEQGTHLVDGLGVKRIMDELLSLG